MSALSLDPPPQQMGRHGVDIGVCGTSIYADGYIHCLVAQGLKRTGYVAGIVIAQRRAQSLRLESSGSFVGEGSLRQGKGVLKRAQVREKTRALSRRTKCSAFMSWGFPDK